MHYLVRIQKTENRVTTNEKITKIVHECVIESETMRKTKTQARKVFEGLPIAEKIKTSNRTNKFKWNDVYESSHCDLSYWDDNNKAGVEVNIVIQPLRDYYEFGKNTCLDATNKLEKVIQILYEERSLTYEPDNSSIGTHPDHLKDSIEDIKEALVLVYKKLDETSANYKDYYRDLGK